MVGWGAARAPGFERGVDLNRDASIAKMGRPLAAIRANREVLGLVACSIDPRSTFVGKPADTMIIERAIGLSREQGPVRHPLTRKLNPGARDGRPGRSLDGSLELKGRIATSARSEQKERAAALDLALAADSTGLFEEWIRTAVHSKKPLGPAASYSCARRKFAGHA